MERRPEQLKRLNLSIIIATQNSQDRLAVCLDSLTHQDTRHSFEIVIGDDGSSDDTLAIGRAFGCRILSQPGRGTAAARNLAASASVGDILVFVSTDVELEEDFLAGLMRPLADAGVQGCTGEIVLIGKPARRASRRRDSSVKSGSLRVLAVRKEAFWNVGGFNETIPDEDTQMLDLYHRLKQSGIRIASSMDARGWSRANRDITSAATSQFRAACWAGNAIRQTGWTHQKPVIATAGIAWSVPGLLQSTREGIVSLICWPAETLLLTTAYCAGLLLGLLEYQKPRNAREKNSRLSPPRLKLVVIEGTLTAERTTLHTRKAA